MSAAPPRLVGVRLTAAACLAAAVAVVVATGWGSPAWWALPALAGAVAVSELAVVHLQFGRQRWTFSLTEAVLGAALVLAPGGWTVAAVALGVASAQRVRAQPPLKLAFNVAQFAASAAAAQAVAVRCGGGVLGACAGLAVFWALNYALVALVVSLTSRRPLRSLVESSAVLSALHTAGNSSIGLLAAFLAREAPTGLLGLVVPLGLLWTSYDQEARRSAEARLFAELARGQEQASDRSADVSAEVVLAAAARLFGGADVEMVLLAADGPVRYAGDEAGSLRRLRVDPDAFDEPWVLRALGAGAVSTGVEHGRPWCAAVLGAPDTPLAVLIARRPPGAAAFGRREVGLVRVLAGQAETWLATTGAEVRPLSGAAPASDRAHRPERSGTTPALTVLRESAGRLSRLAEQDGGVDEIVEELQLVERAVASLLGAVALASVGASAEAAVSGLVPPQRATTDWTTTGLLA